MITNISLTRFKDGQVRDNRIIVTSGLENAFFHADFEKMDRIVFLFNNSILDISIPVTDEDKKKHIKMINDQIEHSEKVRALAINK